jgi:hypothetical protein
MWRMLNRSDQRNIQVIAAKGVSRRLISPAVSVNRRMVAS